MLQDTFLPAAGASTTVTATILPPTPDSSESKQELGQCFTPLPVDLPSECTTMLVDNLIGSAEVLFASREGSMDGSPSISAWDTLQTRFLLVDFGDDVDVRYPARRAQADAVLSGAGIAFLRIVAVRTRQQLAERFAWLPPNTVIWIASEPQHHIDLGGNCLFGPRTRH